MSISLYHISIVLHVVCLCVYAILIAIVWYSFDLDFMKIEKKKKQQREQEAFIQNKCLSCSKYSSLNGIQNNGTDTTTMIESIRWCMKEIRIKSQQLKSSNGLKLYIVDAIEKKKNKIEKFIKKKTQAKQSKVKQIKAKEFRRWKLQPKNEVDLIEINGKRYDVIRL